MFCIAGADGFFGSYIQRELLRRGEKILALNHTGGVFPDSETLTNLRFELTDDGDLDALCRTLDRGGEETKLIYLIASHNPDFVKAQPEKAFEINSVRYEAFLDRVKEVGVGAVWYASSDTVYGEGGENTVFTEESPLCPVNVYGRHKKAAEEITLAHGGYAARFPYMFAPSLCRKKHFFDVITEKLLRGEPIDMFTDYVRSSVTYPTAARYLLRLADAAPADRVFNICADHPSSKYDIGLFAAAYSGCSASLVLPAKMEDAGVFTEKRASFSVMSNERLKRAVGETDEIRFNVL